MNTITKTGVTIAIVGIGLVAYLRKHESIIMQMYPHLDPALVRKAHCIMFARGLNGDYRYKDNSDATMERIFMGIVEEIRSK